MNVVEQEIPMVVVPPPFWKCFGGLLPCAASPMIVAVRGKAGVGKSELAVAIASKYRELGWYTVYLLLEPAREHVARHTADVDDFLRVYPWDVDEFCESFQENYQKSARPMVMVVDSVAALGEGEARMGARRDAINRFAVWAARNLNRFPTILLMVAQYRQGPALPHNPFAVSQRGSFAESNKHIMHVSAGMTKNRAGGIEIEIDTHSLALYQADKNGTVRAAPFLDDFKCATVTLHSLYDLEMPPVLYFPAVVRVYDMSLLKNASPRKSGSGKKRGKNAMGGGGSTEQSSS